MSFPNPLQLLFRSRSIRHHTSILRNTKHLSILTIAGALAGGEIQVIEGAAAMCFDMTVDTLIAGQIATWSISGAVPNAKGVVCWGTSLGQTNVNGTFGYCATFGINGINQNRAIGVWTADANGDAHLLRQIPDGVSGITVHTQAAQRGTCPDECVSNIDTQTIG